MSHYLFEARFGRPGKGNDKGKVEGLVGYVRRNFLVPVPRFDSFESLNRYLVEHCHNRRDKKLRSHKETIGERFERDREKLLPLPAFPYDACDKVSTRVSSLSLVRYKTNDYSVPVAYGHREVQINAYVHAVIIHCGTEEIARHERSYEKEDYIYDPLHYLPLDREEGRCPGSGCSFTGMGVARRVLHSQTASGIENGQERQTAVCSGSQTHGGIPA